MNLNLLLHCCCAPCSVSCVKDLRSEGIEPHLFWYNPNIHPYTEYNSRHECFCKFADNENLNLSHIDEYGLRSFLREVIPEIKQDSRIPRCQKCYRMRLEKTAVFALQEGYSAFSTTLLISPYQDHDAIKRIGEETAKKYGVEFFYRDFRPLFREGQTAARSSGMYMQKYCGCIFSEEERFSKIKNDKSENRNYSDEKTLSTPHSIFERLSLLTGKEGLEKLLRAKVLVFGAGGVGSWAAEALVRSGIGKIGIIDNDTVCASNINRQVEATTLTIGEPKASTLKKRLLEINPECEIASYNELFCLEKKNLFGIENADYVIDAIDILNHKLDLIETVYNAGVTLFSSMGMAHKVDPSQIKTTSIWKTEGCPLARLVRQGLRKRGFSGDFTAVYSKEQFFKEQITENNEQKTFNNDQIKESTDALTMNNRGLINDNGRCDKKINGSIVTVTAAAGFMLASLVINDVITDKQ